MRTRLSDSSDPLVFLSFWIVICSIALILLLYILFSPFLKHNFYSQRPGGMQIQPIRTGPPSIHFLGDDVLELIAPEGIDFTTLSYEFSKIPGFTGITVAADVVTFRKSSVVRWLAVLPNLIAMLEKHSLLTAEEAGNLLSLFQEQKKPLQLQPLPKSRLTTKYQLTRASIYWTR